MRTISRAILTLLTVTVCSGCYTSFSSIQAELAQDKLAVLSSSSDIISIDGKEPEYFRSKNGSSYGWYKLTPGFHKLEYEFDMEHTPIFSNITFEQTFRGTISFGARPGWGYSLRTNGWGGPGYKPKVWIENIETGEVVAGSKPDHLK